MSRYHRLGRWGLLLLSLVCLGGAGLMTRRVIAPLYYQMEESYQRPLRTYLAPILPGQPVSFAFPSLGAGLHGLNYCLVDFGRRNDCQVVASLLALGPREVWPRDRARARLVARQTFSAAKVVDWGTVWFTFPSWAESPNRLLVLELSSPDATPQNCVGVVGEPGGTYFVGDQPQPGRLHFRPLHAAPGPVLWVFTGLVALGAGGLAWFGLSRSPRLRGWLAGPFLVQERPDRWLIGIFILINGLVLVNAIFTYPTVDADAHARNVHVLAQGRLPTVKDSYEFFSPPLPYLLPAAAHALMGRLEAAVKVGQLQNVLASLGICFCLLKLTELARPGRPRLKRLALGLLGLLPVYYSTLAQLRGEPLLVFLLLLAALQAARLMAAPQGRAWPAGLGLGLTLGLAVLARQWAFLALPALALAGLGLVLGRRARLAWLLRLAGLAGLTAALAGGWFYLYLWAVHGRPTAFNRPAEARLLTAKPSSFFLGLGWPEVFTRPLVPSLGRQVWPILYSTLWGDYWFGFLFPGGNPLPYKRPLPEKPDRGWGPYLGRVNAVSLPASLILLAGLGFGLARSGRLLAGRGRPGEDLPALGGLICLCSGLGYLWFLLAYPDHHGDTIKASYLLQAYPFLALLTALALERLAERSPRLFQAALALLAAAWLHNLPLMIGRNTGW